MLEALWMLNIGKARQRGHLFVPGVKVKLQPGRKFEVVPGKFENGELVAFSGLRLFIRICRLAHRLAAMATADGERNDARKLRPTIMAEVEHRCGYEVGFLDTLDQDHTETKE